MEISTSASSCCSKSEAATWPLWTRFYSRKTRTGPPCMRAGAWAQTAPLSAVSSISWAFHPAVSVCANTHLNWTGKSKTIIRRTHLRGQFDVMRVFMIAEDRTAETVGQVRANLMLKARRWLQFDQSALVIRVEHSILGYCVLSRRLVTARLRQYYTRCFVVIRWKIRLQFLVLF